jgi:hypothetical protein
MTAMGQHRPIPPNRAMSADLPIATAITTCRAVAPHRFGCRPSIFHAKLGTRKTRVYQNRTKTPAVLIVEDEPLVRMGVVNIIKDAGF